MTLRALIAHQILGGFRVYSLENKRLFGHTEILKSLTKGPKRPIESVNQFGAMPSPSRPVHRR